jgi:hypothetical protein
MKNSTYSRLSQMVSTVKQVARHDPRGLLAQEHPPRRARPSRRGIKPVAAQRHADGGGRDLHAQRQQLTLDPLVAPARILLREADDQRLQLLIELRPPRPATRIGPRSGDQAAVPAEQRLRRDQEAGPARSREHPADCRQEGAVGGLQPGSWDLAAEDAELMA